jgi:hypothetical protein
LVPNPHQLQHLTAIQDCKNEREQKVEKKTKRNEILLPNIKFLPIPIQIQLLFFRHLEKKNETLFERLKFKTSVVSLHASVSGLVDHTAFE